MCIQLTVLAVFVVWATALIIAGDAYLTLDVLIPSSSSSWGLVASAVPVAALSFIGFDAISTLNEEAEHGGATVARATILVMWCVGVLFVLQVFLAAVLVPTGTVFAEGEDTNNAFYDIVSNSMTTWFGTVVLLTNALIALFANAIASNATSSRLVFSMARDGQLPRFLARVSERKVPQNAMLFIAGLSIGVGILGVTQAGLLITLVTFGALTAYILLNVAVVNHFIIRQKSRRLFLHLVSPVVGTAILLFALWSANPNTKILGVCWLAVGLGVAAYFRASGRSMEQSDL